jgi:hypothetical protein
MKTTQENKVSRHHHRTLSVANHFNSKGTTMNTTSNRKSFSNAMVAQLVFALVMTLLGQAQPVYAGRGITTSRSSGIDVPSIQGEIGQVDETIYDNSNTETLEKLSEYISIEITHKEFGGTFLKLRFRSEKKFAPWVVLTDQVIEDYDLDDTGWSLPPVEEAKVIKEKSPQASTLHTVTFHNLSPNTQYYIAIIPKDEPMMVTAEDVFTTFARKVRIVMTGIVGENGDAEDGEFEFYFYAMTPEAWQGNSDPVESWWAFDELLEEYKEKVVNYIDDKPYDDRNDPVYESIVPYFDMLRYPDHFFQVELADGEAFVPGIMSFVDSGTPGFWLGMGGYEQEKHRKLGGFYEWETEGPAGVWPVRWIELPHQTKSSPGETLHDRECYVIGVNQTIKGFDEDFRNGLNADTYDDSWDVKVISHIEVTYLSTLQLH